MSDAVAIDPAKAEQLAILKTRLADRQARVEHLQTNYPANEKGLSGVDAATRAKALQTAQSAADFIQKQIDLFN